MAQEPLYPFILFSLRLTAPVGSYPAGTEIYFMGDHRRDPELGVKLADGTVSTRVALALPGGADAGTASEAVPCGSFRIL